MESFNLVIFTSMEVTDLFCCLDLGTKSSSAGFLQRTEDLKCSALELRRSQSTGCLEDKSDTSPPEFPYIDSGTQVLSS